jgi:hypothetical protein
VLNGRFAQFDGAGTAFDYVEATGFGRQPYCSLVSGPDMCVAGPQGLAVGTFCWVDPNTGEASNTVTPASLLGFVLPLANNYNLWERAFIRDCPPFKQMILRPGVACVIASMGVFRAKFPNGGIAGARVYADPNTGLPYAISGPQLVPVSMDDASVTMDNASVTVDASSLIPTRWTLTQSGNPYSRLLMSSFVKPLNS